MTAFLGEFLHWFLMLAGAALALAGAGRLFVRGLEKWFRTNSTTDPDICRDKALEMAGDAYRGRR